MIMTKCDNNKCNAIEQTNEIYANSRCFYCKTGRIREMNKI